jgi:hypothetical protein
MKPLLLIIMALISLLLVSCLRQTTNETSAGTVNTTISIPYSLIDFTTGCGVKVFINNMDANITKKMIRWKDLTITYSVVHNSNETVRMEKRCPGKPVLKYY